MSGRHVAILGAVLAILGLGYWFTRYSEDRARIEEDAARRIFSFDAGDVQILSIAKSDSAPVVARRQDGQWAITAPHALPADQTRLERAADSAANLISDRTIDVPAEDLSQYGLDKPALKVAVGAAGEEHTLEFGSAAPTQNHRYARLDGGPVLLLREVGFSELNLSLLDLRNRRIVDAGPAGVQRFEFVWIGRDDQGDTYESVPVRVEKRDDGRWYMTSPVEGAAEQETVNNLAGMLHLASGRDYVDAPESLADYGLDPPRARITAWTAPDSPPQVVYVGGAAKVGEKDGVYARRADTPSVFVLEQGFLEHLPQAPDSFLARALLTHPAADIRTLEYRRGDVDITLENDPDKGWRMARPAVEKTDQEAASAFINRIKGLKAIEFVREKGSAVLEPRTLSLDFALKDGRRISIAVGQPAGEGAYYALQDTGTPALVAAANVYALEVDPFFFQAKEIFEFPQDKSDRIMLNLEGVNYTFERTGDDWLVKEPVGKRWEVPMDAHLLVRTLSSVKAVGVEASSAPADLAPYGLDTPVLTVEAVATSVTRGEGDRTYGPLTIGKPCEGDSQQRYATVAGRPELFRIPQSVLTNVRQALDGLRDAR